MLTPAQMEEGWICLFDGATTFGWKIEGDGKVADGKLALGGDKATTAETTTGFGGYELRIEAEGLADAQVVLSGKSKLPKAGNGGAGGLAIKVKAAGKPLPVRIQVPAGKTVRISKIILKPTGMESIFNGKDLTGWKPVEGKKSVFSVVDGAINIKDGNGEIQSDWQGDDFVLQLQGISHARNLNRGVYFRALPGEFWQGYEAQIRNEWSGYSKDEKRNAEPEDAPSRWTSARAAFTTASPPGGVSSDKEWFTMTVIAKASILPPGERLPVHGLVTMPRTPAALARAASWQGLHHLQGTTRQRT